MDLWKGYSYWGNLSSFMTDSTMFLKESLETKLQIYRVVQKSWDSASSRLSENWDDWHYWNWTQNPPPTFAQS